MNGCSARLVLLDSPVEVLPRMRLLGRLSRYASVLLFFLHCPKAAREKEAKERQEEKTRLEVWSTETSFIVSHGDDLFKIIAYRRV